MSKLIASYIAMWKKAFDFKTRSSRSEYWLAYLATCIVMFLIAILSLPLLQICREENVIFVIMAISMIFGLALEIPLFSLTIRRFHDVGLSGWIYLISLTGIGSIVLFVFLCMDSQPGFNKYGANPKGM